MRKFLLIVLFFTTTYVIYYIAWDGQYDPGQLRESKCERLPSTELMQSNDSSNSSKHIIYPIITSALLASRFNSLEELQREVEIEYFNQPEEASSPSNANSMVRLKHCSNNKEITSELKAGISQNDITKVNGGTVMAKIGLLLKSPFTVANRSDLYKIFNLARRKPYDFGEGDVAFYDLALASVSNIRNRGLAYRVTRDSSEKGYLNTFNHVTAQAFISTCFSEEMADFIADVHERKNMRELITGHFTKEQLADPDKNHIDNYVDMINNEYGQEIGKKLKEKYKIDAETHWTPTLLANYLNDIQAYYSQAFQISFKPFSAEDELLIKYSDKMNVVLGGELPL